MSAPFTVLIPARYGASRLPGKPLLLLDDRPMIAHVCARARESGAARVVVATDDARIAAAVPRDLAEVCLTATDHDSGSSRLAEATTRLDLDADAVVVNLQGDEPLLPGVLLDQVADLLLADRQAVAATLQTPITQWHELFDPNCVKVVSDQRGRALLFSRAPLPWHRQQFAALPDRFGADAAPPAAGIWFRHLGIYAYRAGYLRRYVTLPPAPLEALESLEQLRILWHGDAIRIATAVATPGPGVDTADDLARVRAQLAAGRGG